ncbi:MAG: hypothetical protein IPJ21_01430 [Sterolibacteriaceae bacterium]|nr:hypothetical protein [Sterolibacteriaceae bacterium]
MRSPRQLALPLASMLLAGSAAHSAPSDDSAFASSFGDDKVVCGLREFR